MHVVIFEYAFRPDADRDAYSGLSRRMHEVAQSDERFGYLGGASAVREDGSVIAVESFAHAEGMDRWRRDPQHREAQRRGRDEFYAWYRTRVCAVETDRTFRAGAEDPAPLLQR